MVCTLLADVQGTNKNFVEAIIEASSVQPYHPFTTILGIEQLSNQFTYVVSKPTRRGSTLSQFPSCLSLRPVYTTWLLFVACVALLPRRNIFINAPETLFR